MAINDKHRTDVVANAASSQFNSFRSRFCGLTQISVWLLAALLAAWSGVVLYVTSFEPALDQGPVALARNENLSEKPGFIPPQQIVEDFTLVVQRNKGKASIAETELPYRRDVIYQAILTTQLSAKQAGRRNAKRTADALLLELNNFVPMPSSLTRKDLWERQRNAISSLGGEYRDIGYGGDRPIPAGLANQALTDMASARESQGVGFLAVFALFAFVALKTVIWIVSRVVKRPPRSRKAGGLWIFALLSLFVGAVGYPMAWLIEFNERVMIASPLASPAAWIVFAMALILPFTILTVLYDMLVYRKSGPSIQLDGGTRLTGNGASLRPLSYELFFQLLGIGAMAVFVYVAFAIPVMPEDSPDGWWWFLGIFAALIATAFATGCLRVVWRPRNLEPMTSERNSYTRRTEPTSNRHWKFLGIVMKKLAPDSEVRYLASTLSRDALCACVMVSAVGLATAPFALGPHRDDLSILIVELILVKLFVLTYRGLELRDSEHTSTIDKT